MLVITYMPGKMDARVPPPPDLNLMPLGCALGIPLGFCFFGFSVCLFV